MFSCMISIRKAKRNKRNKYGVVMQLHLVTEVLRGQNEICGLFNNKKVLVI